MPDALPPRGAGGAPRAAAAPGLRLGVQFAGSFSKLPARGTLRRWVLAALERPARVTLRFVGAREGRALNLRFRRKDAPTNVLTFVYDDAVSLCGDIVLCVPVIRSEARAQGKPLEAHLAHLIIHGMLHLHGFEHQRAAQARRMEARETALLARLGFPDPYVVSA